MKKLVSPLGNYYKGILLKAIDEYFAKGSYTIESESHKDYLKVRYDGGKLTIQKNRTEINFFNMKKGTLIFSMGTISSIGIDNHGIYVDDNSSDKEIYNIFRTVYNLTSDDE